MIRLLSDVKLSGPSAHIVVSLTLAAVALAASYAPARRAANVNPMEALRHE